MNLRKAGVAMAFAFLLALSICASSAFADEWDQSMKLSFNQPVQVPGKVLPAGTYWFRMEGGHSDPSGVIPNVVMNVWNTKRTHVIASFNVLPGQTIKDPRTDQGVNSISGHIVITLANRAPEPLALMDVTYPGFLNGEILTLHYPKAEQRSLSDFPRLTMKVGKDGIVQTTDTHTPH